MLGPERVARARAYARLLHAMTVDRVMLGAAVTGKWNAGYCPICGKPSVFVRRGEWLRDHYWCVGCKSIPRQRALIAVLDTLHPEWRTLRIHESSPGGPSSDKLSQECADYCASHFYPDLPPGQYRHGVRSENLEHMTLPDESVDIFVTQDVFEHVMNPQAAFAEVARVLVPGGAHVFTVPYYPSRRTVVRAAPSGEGITYLSPPDYHSNPIDSKGSLVVTEWGSDLPDVIYAHSGMTTTVYWLHDVAMGLEAEFMEVFVSTKSPCPSHRNRRSPPSGGPA